MGVDALQPLEHLQARQLQRTGRRGLSRQLSVALQRPLREQCPGLGVGVQHGAGSAGLHDRQVQGGFGAGFAAACDHTAAYVHLDQLIGADPALVHAAGGHQQHQWLLAGHAAEVAAGAVAPATTMDLGHGLSEALGQARG